MLGWATCTNLPKYRKQSMKEEHNKEQARFSQPTKVTKTWFISKNGEEPFAINEKGAWDLLYNQNRNNLYQNRYEIIGVSDGKTYVQEINKNQTKKEELQKKEQKVSGEIQRYLNSLDRLKFDEFLEDDNEKVMRATSLIEKKEKELEELRSELTGIESSIIRTAFNKELEVARGNIEKPSNQDVKTPNANPHTRNKILNSLGR